MGGAENSLPRRELGGFGPTPIRVLLNSMGNSMKVGIISKEEHIKSLLPMLEREGFVPISLGSSPTEIPSTIPIVVCRTGGCSHGATDVALAWSRSQKGQLIIQNGNKSILNALKKAALMAPNPNVEESPPPSSTEVSTSYEEMLAAAEALFEARPNDGQEILLSTLAEMFPNAERSLLISVVATICPSIVVVEPEPIEPTGLAEVERQTEVDSTPSESMPTTFLATPNPNHFPKRFRRSITESGLRTNVELGWTVRSQISDADATQIKNWVIQGATTLIPQANPLKQLAQKPAAFASALYLCFDKGYPTRPQIRAAYHTVTGREFYSVMADASAWVLGIDINAPLPKKAPPKKAPASDSKPSLFPVPAPALLTPATPPVNEDKMPTSPDMVNLLANLSASLDALLSKVNALENQVADMGARLVGLSGQVNTMAMSPTPAPVVVHSTGAEDAIAALASKGLEIVVRATR
jgi:hypothetical protein